MRAVQIRRFGGPEVLELDELPEPVPTGDPGMLQLRVAVVSYADTQQTEDTCLARQTGARGHARPQEHRKVALDVSGGST